MTRQRGHGGISMMSYFSDICVFGSISHIRFSSASLAEWLLSPPAFIRLSIRLSVCSHHFVNTTIQSLYLINPPNLQGGFTVALSWMVL